METTTLGSWSTTISSAPKKCGSWANSTRRFVIVANVQNSNFRWRKVTTSSRANVAAEDAVSSSKVPMSVPVRVAHELAQAGYRFLDVRTPDEFSIGHPYGAINIPYMYRVGSGMVKNPNFVREVSSHFRKHDEILIGCERGQRSFMASTELLNAGFTAVIYIDGGYVAWTENELPVEDCSKQSDGPKT